MITDQNIVDLSHCIQEQHNIGATTYFNICDGTTHVVPWGAGGWLTGIIIMAFVIFLLAIFAVLTWKILTE